MVRILTRAAVASLVLAFLYFVWPTPFIYRDVQTTGRSVVTLRINRITGTWCVVTECTGMQRQR